MIGFDLMDDLSMIDYLRNFRCYYPGILEWYSGLQCELSDGRRNVFVSRKGTEVQGLAITKNGPSAKLCHISVSPTARDRGLGANLMRIAVSDMMRHGAKEIHVTTGEEVFRNHAEFFKLSGFGLIDWRLNRYRRGASELIWKMNVKSASCSLERTPFLDLDYIDQSDAINSISSSTKWHLATRQSAYRQWFSQRAKSTRTDSLITNVCNAFLKNSTWSAYNSRPNQFETTGQVLKPVDDGRRDSTG